MFASTLRVRPALPTDGPALERLVESTLGECLGMVLPADEIHACAAAYTSRRGAQRWFVAEEEGELTGYAVASPDGLRSPCGPVARLYVHHTDVDTAAERDVAEALVVACGAEREVQVPVAKDGRNTALELYDRWGFVDVEALQRCLSVPSGQGRLI